MVNEGHMRKILLLAFVANTYLFSSLFAATTATATVTYTIGSIDAITVSGNPGPLNVTAATAGNQPTSATDSSTTYAVTTNNTSRIVTGSVATSMPTGTSLSVNLVAPSGGSSAGAVDLTTTAQSLVTGISNVAQGSLTITYILTATVSAAQVVGATNTVTYTIGP